MTRTPRALFFLFLLLISSLSTPESLSNTLRAGAFNLFSGYFEFLAGSKTDKESEEIQQLKVENQLLRNEISAFKKQFEQEHFLLEAALSKDLSPLLQKRKQEHEDYFKLQLSSAAVRVIFRPLNHWTSSLWVDAGEERNEQLGRKVICKNSPVLLGNAIVGVVDYVGRKGSQIRLITDPSLNPSVRIKRGSWLLAKGELRGESTPMLRGRSQRLMGIGFHYDFADEEGPARDLRSGKPLDKDSTLPALPLVQPKDTLVTTGMDGLFPKGLNVGIVERLFPLKEGDCAYDLEALPAAGNLNALTVLFILPPVMPNPN